MADDVYRKRVVLELPGMDRVEVRRDLVYREVEDTRLALDVFLPPGLAAGETAPGVLLIHGGPVPPHLHGAVKRMGVFQSYGELLAASGLVAVACNYFHRGWHDLAGSAENIAAALSWLHDHAEELRLDPESLALWAFSGGGVQLAPALLKPVPSVRCLVAFYALLDLRPVGSRLGELPAQTIERFSPAAVIAGAVPGAARSLPPFLVARAGRSSRSSEAHPPRRD